MAKKDKEKKKHEPQMNFRDEVKRLNRVIGQIEGVGKMLSENRKLGDVLMQCKAIHSALRSVEMRVVRVHVESALDEVAKLDKKKSRAEKIAELEELFKMAA